MKKMNFLKSGVLMYKITIENFGKSLLFAITLLGLLIINGCSKDDSINDLNQIEPLNGQQPEIESLIKDFYELKKEFALQFENRDKISVGDIFYSDEVKDAVIYQLLSLAEMGMINEYNQNVKILTDEIINSENEIIIPGLEEVKCLSIPPNNENAIESEYTDKLFFHFVKINGNWKLKGIEALLPFYEVTKMYNKDVVYPFIIPASEVNFKSKSLDEIEISKKESEIFQQFFKKEIDKSLLSAKLQLLYADYGLLPEESSMKSQVVLDKSGAVKYAQKYAESYNPVYRVFDIKKDCANFVSQSLFVGGGWQFEKPYKNGTTSYSVWWYNNCKTTKLTDDYCSDTWNGADALCNYVCVYNNYATFTENNKARAGTVAPADLVWQPAWGRKTHVMIVTSVTSPTRNVYVIKICGHTTNRKNYTLPTTLKDITFGHFN
jgi:hypothetical protein